MSFDLALLATLLAASTVPAAVDVTPGGEEVRVNTYTSSGQQASRVAVDPAGNYVVIWDGRGIVDRAGIQAQRYNAAGTPQGGELTLNTTTANNQIDPRVAYDSNGNFTVVWESDLQDGDNEGVYFRRFAADGSPLGNETQVNVTTLDRQGEPDIATLPSGGFVVTWASNDGDNLGVFARRYDANGQPVSGEFQVSTSTTAAQSAPAVAADAAGKFVIAWHSAPGFGSVIDLDGDGAGIYLQRFDASGGKVGAETLVNVTTTGDQLSPAIASQPDGSFLVSWETPDGGGFGLAARRFAANGSPGQEVLVNSATTGDQASVTVAAAKTGGYVASWESQGQDDDGFAVVVRELSSTGAPTSGEVVANTATTSSQFEASVAATPNGGFVVSWTSKQVPINNNDVYTRRFVGGGCNTDSATLCLNAGRFSVQVDWATANGSSGSGRAVPLTNDTGFYWFFAASNVEMVIKVLNACGVNGSYWVFAGGLTNVETDILVTDIETGATRSYRNPQNTPFAPIQDTSAFGCNAGVNGVESWDPAEVAALADAEQHALFSLLAHPEATSEPATTESAAAVPAAANACTTDGDTLCLNHGRFAIEVDWATPQGATGIGHPVALTDDTGFFWFFNSSNVEMVIKVLYACTINQRYWTFAGGLTNVETNIRVTDTTTGQVLQYSNPLGTQFQPIQDTTGGFTCTTP
jgi:hypothetical protein